MESQPVALKNTPDLFDLVGLAFERRGCRLMISATPGFQKMWWSPRIRRSNPSALNNVIRSVNGMFVSERPLSTLSRSDWGFLLTKVAVRCLNDL